MLQAPFLPPLPHTWGDKRRFKMRKTLNIVLVLFALFASAAGQALSKTDLLKLTSSGVDNRITIQNIRAEWRVFHTTKPYPKAPI
jgi:hypothetical protein